MPTFTVRFCGDGSTSNGHRKSFQTAVMEKMETTPRIGRDIGRTMDSNVRSGPAPSIAAAAMRSCGIESKNRLSRNMLNALVTAGSQIAHGELSMCQCRIGRLITVTYCGMTSTVEGIIRV